MLSRLSVARERRVVLSFVLLAVEVVTRRAKRIGDEVPPGFSVIASSVPEKYTRRGV